MAPSQLRLRRIPGAGFVGSGTRGREKSYGPTAGRCHTPRLLAIGIGKTVRIDSSSRFALVANSDGSTDVYFGPKPPSRKMANWAPTVKGHDYFLLFRFYGPTEALFDKSWKLNDLKKQE